MARLLTASDLRRAGVTFVISVDTPVFLSSLHEIGEDNPKYLQPRAFDSIERCVMWLEDMATVDPVTGQRFNSRRPIFALEPDPKTLAEIRAWEVLWGRQVDGFVARVEFGAPINLLERIALEVAEAEALDRETPTPAAPRAPASDKA